MSPHLSAHVESSVFSELIGVAPWPWGRVRVEFLGGLGVEREETRDYYEAFDASSKQVAGKYYVLNFESRALGLVLGMDAEISVARGLGVVPTVRWSMMGDPAGTTSYGIGVHWRF